MRRRPLVLAVPIIATAFMTPPARAEWSDACISGAAAPLCHFWRGKLKWADDGDTIDVRMPTSTGKVKTVRVRIIGIQAMEQTLYTSNPRRRKGECHALRATARLEQLIGKGGGRVRLGAQDPASASGRRLRRSVAVKIRGVWRDVGSMLVAEGHALWLPYTFEYAWNATYARFAQEAATRGRNLWDADACGAGPSAGVPLRVTVAPDPRGDDRRNVNGEQVTIQNLSPTEGVPLAGWWLRDSSLQRFRFPWWAGVPPGSSVTVSVGSGTNTPLSLYWGLDHPIFENPIPDGRALGDGAYLFDPQGDLRAWTMYPCYVNCVPT